MKHVSFYTKMKLLLASLLCSLLVNITYAQQSLTPEVRQKLQQAYGQIRKPEISFEKFAQINSYLYTKAGPSAGMAAQNTIGAAASPQDPYCGKVRLYCSNGDFESGLDQTQYTGAYGVWFTGLNPDPFALTYGFNAGDLFDASAHQTIVTKAAGKDPVTSIPLVPTSGGNQALRLGNAISGNGTELIAKTITVDPNETILNFNYAVVLEDPGHPHDDQPAFSVRAYDCATGQELLNVCDLGNGSNIAVADAQNPFFKSTTYNFSTIAYRDWSLAQINLSKYVGKTVIIIFTTKDCNFGAHFGYAYLDNLLSNRCPGGGGTPTDQGSISLDAAKSSTCGSGSICAKYTLPKNNTTTGDITITLDIYQGGNMVKTITSPKLTSGTSYCFNVNPSTLGLNSGLGGFDYTLTGKFSLGGFALSPIVVGNPPTGQTSGNNNDYLITCPSTNPNVYYSKPTGDLHNVLTWGVNPDGSGANPPNFGAGKTFNLANRSVNYNLTANWTVGGLIVNPSGSRLVLNGFTLSEAGISGGGTISGSTTSSLIATGTGGSALNFTSSANSLKNLTISPLASATLGSSLNVYGTLNIQGGSLNTGNLLTLKSTATNTAIVTPVVGTVSGTVTVEQYIPARRAWRLLDAPVVSTQTIQRAWQEGATSVSSNPSPGFGTHITGGPVFGNAANGFDVHAGSESSLKYYSNAANNWLPIPNTNATLVGNTPYMLFIRGDRSLVLDGPTLTPNTTVLRATGTLLTGSKVYNVAPTGFTAIANPYQSPINFATLTKNNVQNKFYVWDPKLGGTYGKGAYVTVSWNGTSYDVTPAPVSPESQYIQPWQSFLVQSTGTSGTLTINENDKVTTITGNVFRTANNNDGGLLSTAPNNVRLQPDAGNIESLRVTLKAAGDDIAATPLDEVLTTYSMNYSAKVDQMDAEKMPNIGENLTLVREGRQLAIERRNEVGGSDTINLQLSNMAARGYVLQVMPVNLSPAKYTAFLEDKYLHTAIPVSVNSATQVPFTVNEDAMSQSMDRFRIVLSTDRSKRSAFADNGERQMLTYPNPVRGNTITLQLVNQPKGVYRVELVNGAGQVMYKGQLEHAGGSAAKTIQVSSKLAQGIYQMNVTGAAGKNTLKVSVVN